MAWHDYSWASWARVLAKQSSVTSTRPPELATPLVWLVTPDGLARLQLGLLGWSIIWRNCSHARQRGMTSTGPPKLAAPLARLVMPISLARLARFLLGK
jgi:hypothetical protein